MVKIKGDCAASDCCGGWKEKLNLAYERATKSINRIDDGQGRSYFPDGTGAVTVPLPTSEQIDAIGQNTEEIGKLGGRMTAAENENTEQNAEIAKVKAQHSADIQRIDAKDETQDASIGDNTDKIATVSADLISTQAAVAANQSDIAGLEAETDALGKSLVSDVVMRDGTTAGSVQVSIEREDGALITSADYKWGKDIGVRLEAGSQEGYIKTLVDLSDGTTLQSNEYKIVEVLESDVYVTAITLVADQTKGTLGGNISYSNGSTQAINRVSVPTAPGVTSAIEALQSAMTAAQQKNTAQDASIQALETRVKNIEDTPGVGQFSAGKLGTIAGSGTDGRIKAEDDGSGSVNGWTTVKSDISQLKISDAEHTETIADQGTQISAQASAITALQGTVAQHTTAIADCFNDVSVDGQNLVLTAVDGQSNSIEIPQPETAPLLWARVETSSLTSFYEGVNAAPLSVEYRNISSTPKHLSNFPIKFYGFFTLGAPASISGIKYCSVNLTEYLNLINGHLDLSSIPDGLYTLQFANIAHNLNSEYQLGYASSSGVFNITIANGLMSRTDTSIVSDIAIPFYSNSQTPLIDYFYCFIMDIKLRI